jgi:hypothetical protein
MLIICVMGIGIMILFENIKILKNRVREYQGFIAQRPRHQRPERLHD